VRDATIDGQLQVLAAVRLLEHSGLVRWERDYSKFAPVSRDTFESYAEQVDPHFGRLICWLNFSVGAELMAKGLCLLHKIEIRTTKKVPPYPYGQVGPWAAQYQINAPGTEPVTNYGTLGALLSGQLQQLCQRASASQDQQNQLLAAYDLLAKSIRNRDTHAYVPKVRDQHFGLVTELFAGCFNTLVLWIPQGKDALNAWMDNASQLIDLC
jgi:hypothetical protein